MKTLRIKIPISPRTLHILDLLVNRCGRDRAFVVGNILASYNKTSVKSAPEDMEEINHTINFHTHQGFVRKAKQLGVKTRDMYYTALESYCFKVADPSIKEHMEFVDGINRAK